MSVEAKDIQKGQILFLDKQAYVVLDVEKLTRTGTHHVKVQLENFMSNHRTEKSFGYTHNVRYLEATSTTYMVTDLADYTGGHQYLTMQDKDTGDEVTGMYVEHDDMIQYLTKHFESDNPEPLSITFTRVEAPKVHRVESDMAFVRPTRLEGFETKHQHDHHHNRHHIH